MEEAFQLHRLRGIGGGNIGHQEGISEDKIDLCFLQLHRLRRIGETETKKGPSKARSASVLLSGAVYGVIGVTGGERETIK